MLEKCTLSSTSAQRPKEDRQPETSGFYSSPFCLWLADVIPMTGILGTGFEAPWRAEPGWPHSS